MNELITAVKNKKLTAVQAYITAGAYLNSRDEYGYTALHWASRKGYTKIAKALIKAGAYVNIMDNNGDTALMTADYCSRTEIVKLLKEAGAIK